MTLFPTISAWFQSFKNLATRDKPKTTHTRSGKSAAGPWVDENNALTFSAVWCAVRAISEPIAAFPYHVYQSLGENNGRKLRTDHPVDWLLAMEPNPEQDAYSFWEAQIHRAILWGNSYAEIERNRRGEPFALWPIDPWRVCPERKESGELVYVVSNSNRERQEIPIADMHHIRGPGDGLIGYSLANLARDSIGLGLTLEQFGSTFFKNGAHLGTSIKAPAGVKLSKVAVDAMLEQFDLRHAGGNNAFKTTFLDQGMEATFPGVPPEAAQFLQTRQFSVIEISRWLRVPPHLLYDLTRATFSNIEHQSLEYVQHTLLPWVRRIEKQTDIKCFGRQQRGVFYSRFNMDGLLRGDIKSRYEAYATARQHGILTANECRDLEERNPMAGGDELQVQVNMISQEQLQEKTAAEIEKLNEPTPAVAAQEVEPKPAAKRKKKVNPEAASAKVLVMKERRKA